MMTKLKMKMAATKIAAFQQAFVSSIVPNAEHRKRSEEARYSTDLPKTVFSFSFSGDLIVLGLCWA